MTTLNEGEMARYLKQINLNEVGIIGQQKLKNARVLCVGAGGLGSPLLLYLAAAGIGTIGIIDDDAVEISNLQRQILYHHEQIGMKKTQAAKLHLCAINPHIQVNTHEERLTQDNMQQVISQYDMVADCSDNFSTRYYINDVCVSQNIPYVSASVSQYKGYCTTVLGKKSACYRCLFPSPPDGEVRNCNTDGVLGVVPGLFGMIQATEIIKIVLGIGETLANRVLTIDLLQMQFREFHLSPNPDCSLCGNYRMISSSEKLTQVQKQRGIKMIQEFIISPSQLKEILDNHQDIQLIDVRTVEKHQAFNIGGVLIPLTELPNRLGELDPNKMTVTYCTSGGRSMHALEYLLSVGFKSVKSLDGGMTAWQAL